MLASSKLWGLLPELIQRISLYPYGLSFCAAASNTVRHSIGNFQMLRARTPNPTTPKAQRLTKLGALKSNSCALMESSMGVTFPNESPEYRAARNKLLQREVSLRREMEAVAAEIRALPRGGSVPEDYEFDH